MMNGEQNDKGRPLVRSVGRMNREKQNGRWQWRGYLEVACGGEDQRGKEEALQVLATGQTGKFFWWKRKSGKDSAIQEKQHPLSPSSQPHLNSLRLAAAVMSCFNATGVNACGHCAVKIELCRINGKKLQCRRNERQDERERAAVMRCLLPTVHAQNQPEASEPRILLDRNRPLIPP